MDAERFLKASEFRITQILYASLLEIGIRNLIIKPLAIGAFYHEEWADILANKIGSGMSKHDRDILPKVLKTIKLDSKHIGDEDFNFENCLNKVFTKRNDIIHKYGPATETDAQNAQKCVYIFMENILQYILKYYNVKTDGKGEWRIRWVN